MLKKIIFMLCIFACLSSTAFGAETAVVNNPSSSAQMTEKNAEQKNKVKKELKEKIKKNNSKKTKLKKAKEFKSITECNSRAARNNLSAYVHLTSRNDFSDKHLDVINRILEKGTTVQTLSEVYEFWLTTDEDFAIIEQICDMEASYFSEYWYENAFNKLTENIHGELTGSEIIEYQGKGISTEDILTANVMSRKNGQNIKSILDMHLSGITLEMQSESLYGAKSEIDENTTLLDAVTELAKSTKAKSEGIALYEGEEFMEVVNDLISEETDTLELSDSIFTLTDDYTALANSEYPLGVQKALIKKGFTPQEIELSSKLLENNFFKAAKKAREMMKNEK